jgi:hydroxyethylthiazole kinase-like uncharacterized protein yjeF
MIAFTAARIREFERVVMDREGDDVLMQRAAAGLARSAVSMLREWGGVYGARVLVLVGPGNNGGDALFASARMARRGVRVEAVRCLGEPHPAGLRALLAAGGRVVTRDELDLSAGTYALVLDGILGIGGRPGLPDSLGPLVDQLTRAAAPVLAVDLPSGVAADTGAVPGLAIRAARTVTFGELKPCHLLQPALGRCGTVELVDIGLGDHSGDPDFVGMDLAELARAWPYPDETSDKYSRGVVGANTGSDEYPGAALMSTLGAVHAGAGMVRFLGPDRPAKLIEAALPNVVFTPGRVQAHLLGSGWGERPDAARLMAEAVESGVPTVVDADGLRHLPDRCPDNWLLTPHAGELGRLVGQKRSWVTDDPVRAARAAAERTGATVLLKGASQVVAGPGSVHSPAPVRVALPGPAWTAQAGSGDVLGGVCATLLAAGLPPGLAGQVGASVQAAAAAEHPGAIAPGDLAKTIGSLVGALEKRRWAR